MIIINTQEELESLIDDNNNIIIEDDLMLNCDIKIEANIIAFDIKAQNIELWDLKVADVEARNIKAGNINAWNLKAENIEASIIKAKNIESWDLKAANIEARNIKAENISYFAVCFAYNSIICKSIKGRRVNSKHFVLDGTITETNNN